MHRGCHAASPPPREQTFFQSDYLWTWNISVWIVEKAAPSVCWQIPTRPVDDGTNNALCRRGRCNSLFPARMKVFCLASSKHNRCGTFQIWCCFFRAFRSFGYLLRDSTFPKTRKLLTLFFFWQIKNNKYIYCLEIEVFDGFLRNGVFTLQSHSHAASACLCGNCGNMKIWELEGGT